jgi:hypothetical protein
VSNNHQTTLKSFVGRGIPMIKESPRITLSNGQCRRPGRSSRIEAGEQNRGQFKARPYSIPSVEIPTATRTHSPVSGLPGFGKRVLEASLRGLGTFDARTTTRIGSTSTWLTASGSRPWNLSSLGSRIASRKRFTRPRTRWRLPRAKDPGESAGKNPEEDSRENPEKCPVGSSGESTDVTPK